MNLVIQLARPGDLLQTARLLLSLQAQEPTYGETHLLVDEGLVSLALQTFPGIVVHGVSLRPDSPAHNATLFRMLRSMKFTCVYNLNYSGLNRAVARLFPANRVCGYSAVEGQAWRNPWMRMAMRWTTDRRSAPLNLVDFWGLMAPLPLPPQHVNPPAIPRHGPLGVALAGKHARRSLPPSVLGPVVHTLSEILGCEEIWLLGSKAERELSRELFAFLPGSTAGKVTNMTGRTSLTEVYGRVGELGCLLTPDTGLMHMAARLGVPVQATFLSSAWAWETGPYGTGHTVWQAEPHCAPCSESTPCPVSPENRFCLLPFGRKWLQGLRDGAVPSLHLRCMESAFDSLGQIWQNAEPNPQRDNLRRLLAQFHGLGGSSPTTEAAQALQQTAAQFFLASDWMLPHARSLE